MATRGRARWRWASLVVAVVAAGAACQPVPHPDVVLVASNASGLRARGVSGDGRFVIATSTGSGPIVPSAGAWRIRRSDHSLVALPSNPEQISRDGSRIQLSSGAVWVDGSVRSYPAHLGDGALSPDLDAGAYRDLTGTMRTWNLVTDTVAPIDPVLLPPADAGAIVAGVSDGGRVVRLRWSDGTGGCTNRFVDRVAGTYRDVGPPCSSSDLKVSADGASVLALTSTTARIIDTHTGASGAAYSIPAGRTVDWAGIADTGGVGWLSLSTVDPVDPSACGGHTPCTMVSSRTLVSVDASGAISVPIAVGRQGTYDLSRDGRFVAISQLEANWLAASPYLPVQVADRLSGNVETLAPADSPPYPGFLSSSITDDGRLVVTASANGGWYEYAAAP